MKIELYEDGSHEWRWRAVDGNNRIIADSAEGYVTRQGVERALDNVINEFRGELKVVTRKPSRARSVHDADGDPDYIELSEYEAEGAHEPKA